MITRQQVDDAVYSTRRYIKSIGMYIAVVIVAFIYVFWQIIKFEPTDASFWIAIAEGIVGVICGVAIKQALGELGFAKGYNSEKWQEEESKYNEACDTANDYMERVDNFYEFEIIEKKKKNRRTFLQGARLKYAQWFDIDGNYIGTKEMWQKLDLRQRMVVRKCIRLPIYPLNLFGEYEISADQDSKKEKTTTKQRISNLTKNSISALVIAGFGAYFMPMITNWSWASFIKATFQVAMWVLFGVIQLYGNYDFIVNEKVSILRKKKELICKFVTGCERGMYLYSPYDGLTMLQIEQKTITVPIQE